MSCDGLFVLRRGGHEAFHYDRWAAGRIDRLLLGGAAATVTYIESLTATAEPVTVAWLCGAVLVDLDRRALLYWPGACPWPASLQRHFATLLRDVWPGFAIREAMRPLLEFAEALGRTPRELAEARARATLLAPAVTAELCRTAWHEFRAGYADKQDELARWIAECGEEDVRAAAEFDCDALLTLRAADGSLHEQRATGWMHDSLLRAGPALVEAVREGPPRQGLLWPGFETSLREWLLIDEAARTVHWWHGRPEWMNPAGFCAPLWPGWTLVPEPQGPRALVMRSGRSLAEIRRPPAEVEAELTEQLARRLADEYAPRDLLAREAARLASEHPGAEIRVVTDATSEHDIGRGTVDAALARRIAAVVAEIEAES